MDLGSLGQVVYHLQGMMAGFLITTYRENGWTIPKMITEEEASLIGQCQWTGVIGTTEEMPSSQEGEDLRGGHHLLCCCRRHHHHHPHFLTVTGGLVILERGAAPR